MESEQRTVESMIEEAHLFMMRGRHDDARRLLGIVLTRDPGNVDALAMSGRLSQITGMGASPTVPYPRSGAGDSLDYASQIAYQAGLTESARLGVAWNPYPNPVKAAWVRTRVALIIVLCLILPFAVRAAVMDGKAGFTSSIASVDEYEQSPGCGGKGPINNSYPPCTFENAVIVAKTSQSRGCESYGTCTTYGLRVRRADGAAGTFSPIGDYLWGQVRQGEQVRLTVWRGMTMELTAPEGDTFLAPIDPESRGYLTRCFIWISVAFLDLTILGLFFPRRRGLFGSMSQARNNGLGW